jgi:hypothetical protein
MELEALQRLDREIRAELEGNKHLGKLITESLKGTKQLSDEKAMKHIKGYIDDNHKEAEGDAAPTQPMDTENKPVAESDGKEEVEEEPARKKSKFDPTIPAVPSSQEAVEKQFRTYYTFQVMCAIQEGFEARHTNSPMGKAMEKMTMVRAELGACISEFLSHSKDNKANLNACDILCKTHTVRNITAEALDKQGVCNVSGQKVRKGQCSEVTFHLADGTKIPYIMANTWLQFFRNWATLVLLPEILRTLAKKCCGDGNVAEKLSVATTDENVKKAWNVYSIPLKFFYEYLPAPYQIKLCQQFEKHWFV